MDVFSLESDALDEEDEDAESMELGPPSEPVDE
jgi:hypothetical protein